MNKNLNEDRELYSYTDGYAETSEGINTFLISHKYETMPKINKFKSDRRARRIKEDEHTKMYIIENNQARTVVDMGGESLIMGLEFTLYIILKY